MGDNKENPDIGTISKKALMTDSIKFKNGELLIWNIRAMIFSNYSLSYMFRVFDVKKSKEGIDGLYWMSFYQAVGATTVTKQRFGINTRVLENIVGQGEMLGYGKTKINRANFNDCHFIFETQSSLAKEFLSIFGIQKTPVCHHLRGLLAGTISTLTQKDIICIEEKCIAKGNQSCVFIVRPKDEFDMKNEDIKSQVPEKFPNPNDLGYKRNIAVLEQKKF